MRNLSPDALPRDSPAIDHLARSRTGGEPDVAPATCAGPRDGARLVDVPPMRWRHERRWFTSTAGGGLPS
ncbi:hypothetical protein OG439_11250 [Amycolatopsis sp. NBC_01307]|uniref:hypothetical protein n=1 Tax=Amycolatopsis sp. NBC_01307 TaxID=2903561 RepID=UPI002E0DED45|nr:hypothetical protein OG439_11250 [Amycolatopsis sp. NBC_01307]